VEYQVPLRVNPCLPAGRLSPSAVLGALSLSKGKPQQLVLSAVEGLCWGVEGLTEVFSNLALSEAEGLTLFVTYETLMVVRIESQGFIPCGFSSRV
jgi:hypothetical protein